MIQGIFYARFFPQEGTKIYAQSPPGCIVPVPGVDRTPLFDFSILQEYIIPRKSFYNRYITVNDPDGKYTVLGFPVSIPSPRYDRNEFIFNFGLVVEAGADQVPYERVVRRLAVTFAEMEKQDSYLSRDPDRRRYYRPHPYEKQQQQQQLLPPRSRGSQQGTHRDRPDPSSPDSERRPIESLLEIIKEDLNNYGECMIPVDEANTINMKLFPYHPSPPEVKGWHVPVPKMRLTDIVDATWDITLQRVIAHIDGVSDVRRIAFEAGVALDLACLALRHLLYYDTVLLLDIFFFGACYAPRPGIHDFVANVGGIVDECAYYVCIGPGSLGGDDDDRIYHHHHHHHHHEAGSYDDDGGDDDNNNSAPHSPSSYSVGHSWQRDSYLRGHHRHHDDDGGNDDDYDDDYDAQPERRRRPPSQRVSNYQLVKLMTTFCAGKSVMEWLKGHMDDGFDVLRYVDVRRLVQFGVIKGCLYRVHKHVVSQQYLASLVTGQSRPVAPAAGGDPLQRYTDGCHHFDQIVTEQNLTDAEIMDKLKSFRSPAGDLSVLYR